eukprot:PhM_4_TR16085/c0_g1_i1/m.38510
MLVIFVVKISLKTWKTSSETLSRNLVSDARLLTGGTPPTLFLHSIQKVNKDIPKLRNTRQIGRVCSFDPSSQTWGTRVGNVKPTKPQKRGREGNPSDLPKTLCMEGMN